MGRTIRSTLVCLALASAMHLDWHFARPAHHQLSLGLSWHWVLAIPAFGLVAWYVQRTSPDRLLRASVSIVLCAILIAGVVEPAYEYFLGGATFEWAFGLERIVALATFVAVGVVAHAAVLAFFRRRASIAGASAPAS
ncbi:MAG TPA: hypothetical protein VFZ73_13745 [Gemmatimonadaceae bacterium]